MTSFKNSETYISKSVILIKKFYETVGTYIRIINH